MSKPNFETDRTIVFDLETSLIDKGATNGQHARACKVYDVAWCWLGEPARVDDDERHLLAALREASVVVAHNIDFDLAVLREMSPEARALVDTHILDDDGACMPVDTMAMARLLNLPASLGGLGPALGVGEKMDITFVPDAQEEGLDLFQGDAVVNRDDIEYKAKRREYAANDVNLTARALLAMQARIQPEIEWDVMAAHTRINARGIKVNRERLHQAVQENEAERLQVAAKFKATYGFNPSQDVVVLQWIKRNGHPGADSVRKEDLERLRATTKNDRVRDLIDLRTKATGGDLSKLRNIVNGVDPDGRIRHSFTFAAAHTGRFSSEGIQVHNCTRPLSKAQEAELAERGRLPNELCRPGTVRSVLTHERDHVLFISDFAQIELRISLAMAGQADEVRLMHEGGDLYTDLAMRVYGAKAKGDKVLRHRSKAALLAIQYGAGAERLKRTLDLATVAEAEALRNTTHERFSGFKRSWNSLECAAREAILRADSGRAFTAGVGTTVEFECRRGVLAMKLPSGRRVCYRDVALDKEGLFTCADHGGRKKIGFGGMLLENACQSIGRDYLVRAIVGVSRDPAARVVSHVHDEVIAEVAVADQTPEVFARLEKAMLPPESELPPGLLLACESDWSPDFRK